MYVYLMFELETSLFLLNCIYMYMYVCMYMYVYTYNLMYIHVCTH